MLPRFSFVTAIIVPDFDVVLYDRSGGVVSAAETVSRLYFGALGKDYTMLDVEVASIKGSAQGELASLKL